MKSEGYYWGRYKDHLPTIIYINKYGAINPLLWDVHIFPDEPEYSKWQIEGERLQHPTVDIYNVP